LTEPAHDFGGEAPRSGVNAHLRCPSSLGDVELQALLRPFPTPPASNGTWRLSVAVVMGSDSGPAHHGAGVQILEPSECVEVRVCSRPTARRWRMWSRHRVPTRPWACK